MNAYDASEILGRLGIPRDADFHALPSAQVERLLDEADRVGYRKPANANGSTGRYFFALLQRKASNTKSGD